MDISNDYQDITNQDIKREKILEAAHQRFLHYGYSKTTMNEIAGDLAMSKALLYYYFPDKSQLYIAVMRKLANDYLKTLEENKNAFDSLEQAFIFQINIYNDFILNNYNFFDFFRLNEQNLPDMIWQIIAQIHTAELNLLLNALNIEMDRGRVKPIESPCETLELLLDALQSVRASGFTQTKPKFPKRDDLEEIYKKKLVLVDIFINGLCN
jgi:TetR/AcrR family transcriptional repressor of mexJK operon